MMTHYPQFNVRVALPAASTGTQISAVSAPGAGKRIVVRALIVTMKASVSAHDSSMYANGAAIGPNFALLANDMALSTAGNLNIRLDENTALQWDLRTLTGGDGLAWIQYDVEGAA